MHTRILKLFYMYTEILHVSAMDVKYKDCYTYGFVPILL